MAQLTADLLTQTSVATQKAAINKDKYEDIRPERLQDYPAARMLLNKEHFLWQAGGTEFLWEMNYTTEGRAAATGFAPTITSGESKTLAPATAPWRKAKTDFDMSADIEAINSPSAERLVNTLKLKRDNALTDFIELMEALAWAAPSATTDNVSWYGIPAWITPSATAAPGFNGIDCTTITGGAGAARSTYTGLCNATGTYVSVTKEDYVKKIRQLLYLTHFVALPIATDAQPMVPTRGLYSTYKLVEALQELLNLQNDNLGRDVLGIAIAMAANGMSVLVGGHTLIPVPKLDALEASPAGSNIGRCYGIDWSKMRIAANSNYWSVETSGLKSRSQPTVSTTFIDHMGNFICTNPRTSFVIYKTAAW